MPTEGQIYQKPTHRKGKLQKEHGRNLSYSYCLVRVLQDAKGQILIQVWWYDIRFIDYGRRNEIAMDKIYMWQ